MHRLPVVTHPRPHAHGGHGVPVGCMLVRLVLAIRPTVAARPVALACLTVDPMGKKALFFESGGTNGGTNQI